MTHDRTETGGRAGEDRHPGEGRLQAHLDGELPSADAARLEDHLARCAACRGRRQELAEASEALRDGLAALDVPPPPADPLAVRRAARRRRPGSSSGRSVVWKAAVLVVGVAAAASATVPGSPVEGWIGDAVRAVVASFDGETAPTEAPSAGDTAEGRSGPRGVSVPVSGRAIVRITDPAPGLRLRVVRTEDGLLSVTARGGRYRVGEGRVEVIGPDGPELRVELPSSAPVVRIVAGDRVLLERADGRLRIRADADTAADGSISFPVDGGGR